MMGAEFLVLRRGPDATFARLSGDLEATHANWLAEKLAGLDGDIYLDCSRVDFIDIRALAVLVRCSRDLETRGRMLSLNGLPERRIKMIELLGFDTLLQPESPSPALPTISTLDELCDLVRRRPGLLVRYSGGPDHDAHYPSCDDESGLELPGLSASPLDPEPWWTRPLDDWVARRLCNHAHRHDESDGDRRAWVLYGPVIARGPDDEPLVHPATPFAWIADEVLEDARARYEASLDAGRDSRDAARYPPGDAGAGSG